MILLSFSLVVLAAMGPPVVQEGEGAARAGSGASPRETVAPSNVLLVILDDVGLDAIGCYPGANDDAKTPCMDRLSAEGVRFETVWGYPACSPTRATIMSGQYGFRTGIGSIVKLNNDDPGLGLEVTCLPEALAEKSKGVRTAFLGKWHLSGVDHGPDHAREQGFEHFRGTVSNLGRKGRDDPYFHYDEIVDGKEQKRDAYATTAVTDDALRAIERFGDERWLVVASYHAAHGPLHAPPKELRTIELSGSPKKTRHQHFAAMVEALDHEIGRLWDSLPEATRARTTIVIVGDNGGASGQMPDELRLGDADEKALAGKGSLSESGIEVPLIVAGAGVSDPGRAVSHLVNTTDLFDTTLDLLLGVAPEGTPDSVSFRSYLASAAAPPVREWIFSERFHRTNKNTKAPASSRLAIREQRYKLIEDSLGGGQRLYDLESDPRESSNLLKGNELDEGATAALARMTALLEGPLGKDRKAALAGLQ
ncbi:sulfatase-like hydrolase/transferase [Saltatorellus ferox]